MSGNEWATVNVTGLKELQEALKQLPVNIGKNVLRGATRAGAAVIRVEAKNKAPVYTGPMAKGHPPPGTLKRSVYQKQIRELSSAVQQTFYVGVRIGKDRKDNKGRSLDAYYWRFVEFGTAKMPARPFMRPAFEAKKMEALYAIKNYMAERIPREVEKLKQGPRV
jgi:HK97 gp10 family phage protein